MRRLFVFLTGGLGNQMFQYAAGRAVAARNGAELVLDTWSGFVRDRQYHRHYELDALPIQARPARASERLPIWLYRLDARLRPLSSITIQKRLYGQFLVENASRFFLPDISAIRFSRSAWMIGYWQSSKYFEDCAAMLHSELMPPVPTKPKFLDLGAAIRDSESVALGIRLYEESTNPAVHAREGKIKTTADVNQAIQGLQTKCPGAKFFVFCTHRSPALAELNLPKNSVFVTHDDGYEGTLERIWLLSQCRHHVFTNSSYYWWGAWLSHSRHKDEKQLVYAANNFINEDGLCANWEQF